jgi:methyl-accepting chemotaxis protein
MIGEIVQTVSSASTQLEASAGTLSATAKQSQTLTSTVASASKPQRKGGVATEELSSVTEIGRQVGIGAGWQPMVGQARVTNDRVSQSSGRIGDVVELINTIAARPLAGQRHHEAARAVMPVVSRSWRRKSGARGADGKSHRRDQPADHRYSG